MQEIGLLPEQWAYLMEATDWSPERKLLYAVVTDAIGSLLSPWRLHEKSRRQADLAWLNSRDQDYAFSFETCCLYLNLDASAVREAVLRRVAEQDAPAPKRASVHNITRGCRVKPLRHHRRAA